MPALLTLATLTLGAGAAFAQDGGDDGEDTPRPRRRLPPLGVNAGVFTPLSGGTRDRFGGTWISFGPGFGAVQTPRRGGSLFPDIGILGGRRGDNRAFLLQFGAEWRTALSGGEEDSRYTPYIAAGGNFFYTRLRSDADGVRAGWRPAAGASAALGLCLGHSAFIEARYRGITAVRGFDLSGAQLRAGIRF